MLKITIFDCAMALGASCSDFFAVEAKHFCLNRCYRSTKRFASGFFPENVSVGLLAYFRCRNYMIPAASTPPSGYFRCSDWSALSEEDNRHWQSDNFEEVWENADVFYYLENRDSEAGCVQETCDGGNDPYFHFWNVLLGFFDLLLGCVADFFSVFLG